MSNSGSNRPRGRPRWLHTVTRAPASVSMWIVGSTSRMRVSSLISPPLSGTFRSARSSTLSPVEFPQILDGRKSHLVVPPGAGPDVR